MALWVFRALLFEFFLTPNNSDLTLCPACCLGTWEREARSVREAGREGHPTLQDTSVSTLSLLPVSRSPGPGFCLAHLLR